MADYKWNSVQDFANSVREKYPVYKDWSDADLTRAMFEKFPQYVSQVATSVPRKKSTYDSTPATKFPFLNEAVTSLAKQRDEAIGKGDVSTAREKEFFRSAGQTAGDIITDPTNLALAAASSAKALRLPLAAAMGGLGLGGLVTSPTSAKDIYKQTKYSVGLSDEPSKTATPEASKDYLFNLGMLSGAGAASGEKASTEPTAKVLDKMSKAFKSTGKLKTVAGIAGGLSTAAVTEQTGLGHPFIGYLVGREAGKAAYSGVDNVLEAAPKALRSHAFETYQDFMNKDLLAKSGKGGTGGAASPGPGAVSPSNSPSAPTGGAATGVGNVGTPIAALPAAPGQPIAKPSDIIKSEKQFREEAPDQPSVPMRDIVKLINEGVTKWGTDAVDNFTKNLMSQKPVPNTQERFAAWQDFVEHGPKNTQSQPDIISEKPPQTPQEIRSFFDKYLEDDRLEPRNYKERNPEQDTEIGNLVDKLIDHIGEDGTRDFVNSLRARGITPEQRISEMKDLITEYEKPKTPVIDRKEWVNALRRVGNVTKPTSRTKPIKLPDIKSGGTEQQYLDAFEALTRMLPKMLGQEGEVMSNTLSKAVAEGNMPAQEALIHATAWINEVQRKAYQMRGKKPGPGAALREGPEFEGAASGPIRLSDPSLPKGLEGWVKSDVRYRKMDLFVGVDKEGRIHSGTGDLDALLQDLSANLKSQAPEHLQKRIRPSADIHEIYKIDRRGFVIKLGSPSNLGELEK